MLGSRLTVSAVLIPALIGLFWLDAHGGDQAFALFVFCLFLAIRSVWEMRDLLTTRTMRPALIPMSICSAAIVLAGWWHARAGNVTEASSAASLGLVAIAYALSVLVLMAHRAVRYRKPGNNMETLGAELLTTSYVGLLLAITAQLRWVAGGSAGYLVLGSLVLAAKMGDIGAYTFGRLWGKRKMAPTLSPGKTWMGFVGAVVGSGAGGCLWLHFATPLFDASWKPPAAIWAILYGVIIGVVGLVGDLCESLIKRDVEKKDSAELLPGFGGLLDLLDSVLFAGPVAYVLWLVLPLRTW